MGTPLLAEDLLLLLMDDEKGTLPPFTSTRTVLGGALLADLATAGLVEVEVGTSRWKAAKVQPTGAATSDPLLADALAVVEEKPRSAADLVDRLGKACDDVIAERLAERGILEREDSKMWGVFSRTRWPAVDTERESEVRRALTDALVGGAEPDGHVRSLAALLLSVDRAHQVVERGSMSARDVKKRAKELADGDWPSKAVKDAVGVSAATLVAATGASTAATS